MLVISFGMCYIEKNELEKTSTTGTPMLPATETAALSCMGMGRVSLKWGARRIFRRNDPVLFPLGILKETARKPMLLC